MTTNASSPGHTGHLVLPPPWTGLLAFAIAFLWKPVAHTISVLNHTLFPGLGQFTSAAVIGVAGFALVWLGLKRDELAGTVLGFLGGSLIFLGLVEPSFWLFGQLFAVPPLVVDGSPVLSPNLLLMEASSTSFFVLLIFLGLDKDTKCRMFLWFHRNFRLRPDAPTPGYRRQPARITALETIMISWFFYIYIIVLMDPRLFGRGHFVTRALFVVMLAWGLYLVVAKLARYRALGPALRYAIPVAGIVWFDVELAAQWKWYTELWVRPVQFPAANVGIGVLFVAALAGGIAWGRSPAPGATPAGTAA